MSEYFWCTYKTDKIYQFRVQQHQVDTIRRRYYHFLIKDLLIILLVSQHRSRNTSTYIPVSFISIKIFSSKRDTYE